MQSIAEQYIIVNCCVYFFSLFTMKIYVMQLLFRGKYFISVILLSISNVLFKLVVLYCITIVLYIV